MNYVSSVTITFFLLSWTSPLPVAIRENRYALKYEIVVFFKTKQNKTDDTQTMLAKQDTEDQLMRHFEVALNFFLSKRIHFKNEQVV